MDVKVSGKVYHLENGNQNNIMINMSSDPFDSQAVYVKRKEQDQKVVTNKQIIFIKEHECEIFSEISKNGKPELEFFEL